MDASSFHQVLSLVVVLFACGFSIIGYGLWAVFVTRGYAADWISGDNGGREIAVQVSGAVVVISLALAVIHSVT